MKYLGTNLTKRIQDLPSETHKILMKETQEDLVKWTDIAC